MSTDRALVPTNERAIDFYGDELRVFVLDGSLFGRSVTFWASPGAAKVRGLSEMQCSLRRSGLYVQHVQTPAGGRPELLCLPRAYLNGSMGGVVGDRGIGQ